MMRSDFRAWSRHTPGALVSGWLGAFALALWFAFAPKAQALDAPALDAHVTDQAGLLDANERGALESKLASHEQATGQQFALLIVPTLSGDSVEEFSMRVVEKAKLGAKKIDNGLLMLVVPEDHDMRIEVGYGLEGVVTDAFASQVVREVMAPAFRREAYADGINRAFDLLMAKAQGTAVSVPRATRRQTSDITPLIVLAIFIVLFVLGRIFPGGGGRRRRGGFWSVGGFGGGGFGGGFGGGRSGWGGGGGGGWGGGGGGGFGGGGASGKW